jgi:hypothetical protein
MLPILIVSLCSLVAQLVVVKLMCIADDARLVDRHWARVVARRRAVAWDPWWSQHRGATGRE